jgi:hypothetical protein
MILTVFRCHSLLLNFFSMITSFHVVAIHVGRFAKGISALTSQVRSSNKRPLAPGIGSISCGKGAFACFPDHGLGLLKIGCYLVKFSEIRPVPEGRHTP